MSQTTAAPASLDLAVGGMVRGSCAMFVQRILSRQVGVESAIVNYATSTAHVVLGERLADPDALLAPVEHLGYWLTPREAGVVVGRRLGVQRVLAQVLLADKQAEVAALEAAGEVVAVVGDGINDAPALVQDDLGSAIGTGTDVAIQSRDLALMPADLARIPTAISLSRRIYRTIVHTLYWAFGCNIVAVPLAAAGLLNPIISGAARGFSSAGVVTNSLCLLQFER